MVNSSADVRKAAPTAGVQEDTESPAPSQESQTHRSVTPAEYGEAAENPPARLPRSIAGGFRGVGETLDQHAREWRNMARLLEIHRPHLEIAEIERDRLYDAFERLVPEVQEKGQALKDMLEAMKEGDISGELAPRFRSSLESLERLEALSVAMATNLLTIRSAWEQYADSIVRAEGMRRRLPT